MSSTSSPEHTVEGGCTVVEREEVDMRSVPRSPLHELSQRQARRRTNGILTQLRGSREADYHSLLGYLLYSVNYTHDKSG